MNAHHPTPKSSYSVAGHRSFRQMSQQERPQPIPVIGDHVLIREFSDVMSEPAGGRSLSIQQACHAAVESSFLMLCWNGTAGHTLPPRGRARPAST